jgi:hypothetical protein
MSAGSGTLEIIGQALAVLFRPLEDRLRAGDVRLLLSELGLTFPAAIDGEAGLGSSMGSAAQRLQDLPPIITALESAIEASDTGQIIAKGLELANAIVTLITEFEKLANAIKALAGTGIPQAELDQFASELPGRLVDYLVVRNLEGIPGAAEGLDFIGFVERTAVPAVDAQHPAFVRRKLRFDQFTAFLGSPLDRLKAMYQWGDPGFTGLPLLQKITALLASAGVPAVLDTSGPVPVLDFIFVEVKPKLDVDPKGLIIKIIHPLVVDNAQPFVQDDWQVTAELNAQLDPGLQIILQPNDGVTLLPVSGTVQGDLKLDWTGGKPGGKPYLILGEPGSSRLEAKQLIASAGVGFAWNAGQNRAEGTFTIGGEIKGGKLVISLASADGFIGQILSGFGLESEFGVGLGYSTKQGFYFHGSATLDIQLPLHIQLGPVELSALTLTVGIQGTTFPIGLRTDIKAALGPLEGVVQQIGAGVDLSIPPDHHGNAGPVDFKLKFLPPKGVGLSLDLEVVKGGGFLFIDPDRGEYAGTLQLSFIDIVQVTAIGIITTKMPDGSPGFSLLLILTADFGPGIQLGFGFTLLAVGGLIGLNRTMNLQALMDGVRTGAIQDIMFPQDVVANAPKIISDLRAIFPPQEGKFLIGPMLKLGWGTPTLVSVAMGVIIEIPGNIAILGILKIAIPADELALIILQVNFAGAIEFDKKRIYFFAALFESRIVFLTIEGEMGLLVAFGDDANFVVSVGGFHPSFTPPPLPFPSPKRIKVSLLSTPVSRLTVDGYFAVTSNTVQFGAHVDVFFGLDILNVQGNISFDALFQFNPFKFIIQLSASFSVNVFGAGLFSVGVSGLLEGPSPYHVKGHGSISILFWDIGVDFETTWGEKRDTSLQPIAVLPLLEAELNKADNWRAELPAGNNLLVSLRKLQSSEADLILHPLGVLHISQRAVPLEIHLDKVGNQPPGDVNRVAVDVAAASGLVRQDDTFEEFAPAQFQNYSDSDKLSRPAFAPERSGLDLKASGADLNSSEAVKRVVRYEEILIDNNYKRFRRPYFRFFGTLFELFLRGGAVAKNPLSQTVAVKLQPFADKITVQPETYSVANQANNQAFAADSIGFYSEASAREYMNQKIAAEPTLVDQIHVIPEFERAA